MSTHRRGRVGQRLRHGAAAGLLTTAALAGGILDAGTAAAATTTLNCDTAAQPSATWTSCQQLTGTAKCVWNNGDGTWTLALGYVNPTTSNLFASIPSGGTGGTNNALTATNGTAADPAHLSTFPPGTSTTAFTVTWSPTSKTDPLTWVLMGHTYTWVDTYTACAAKPVPVEGNVVLGAVGLAAMTGGVLFRRRRLRPLHRRAGVPA